MTDTSVQTVASRREQLLDATASIVISDGWTAVTMSRLAAAVQISRQSVYNEFGGKDKLAVALVTRESDRLLATVALRLLAHQDDMTAAVSAAVRSALELGEQNPLIKAVVSSGHGNEVVLLPLLTVRPEPVLEAAVAMMTTFADEHWTNRIATRLELDELMDAVVRLTLSHLVQPRWPVQRVTAMIRRMVDAAQVAVVHP